MTKSKAPSSSGETKLRWIYWLPVLLGALTILSTPWPPMLDWPLHIAQGSLLARMDDPSFIPAGVYCRNAFASYHIFHHFVGWIYSTVGPHWVSRIVLLLLYGLFVLSVWAMLAAYRSESRLIAFGIPAFFGYNYLMGFGSYLLSIPLVLLSVAAAQYWMEKKHWRWGVVLTLSLMAVYLGHALAFYTVMVALGLRWCFEWSRDRHWRWRYVGALLLPGIAGIYQFVLTFQRIGLQKPWWDKVKKLHPELNWNIREPSILEKLQQVPYYLVGNENLSFRDVSLGILLLALLIALLIVSTLHYRNKEKGLPLGKWALAATPFVFFLVIPKDFAGVNHVYGRFLIFSYLLLIPLIGGLKPIRWGQRLAVLGLATSLCFLTINATYHLQWNESLKGFHQIKKKIPQKSRVLGLLSHYRHAPAILQSYKGGESVISFSLYRHMPVVDCQFDRQVSTWHLSVRPHTFNPQEHVGKWDYLLLYISGKRKSFQQRYPWLFLKDSPYRPLYKAGRWLLASPRTSQK